MTRIIGIDYSLTSPALTVLGKDGSFISSKIYFLTSIKKFTGQFGNIIGLEHEPYSDPIERYLNIAESLLTFAKVTSNDLVFLEDYSMGSSGKVFHIAENTGILKYKLYTLGCKLETIPPTVIKKHFATKGNADKNKMYEAFQERTGIDLYAQLHTVKASKVASPISDIVDSYAISLFGMDKIKHVEPIQAKKER